MFRVDQQAKDRKAAINKNNWVNKSHWDEAPFETKDSNSEDMGKFGPL